MMRVADNILLTPAADRNVTVLLSTIDDYYQAFHHFMMFS